MRGSPHGVRTGRRAAPIRLPGKAGEAGGVAIRKLPRRIDHATPHARHSSDECVHRNNPFHPTQSKR
ncbi:hypothetical protein WT15_08390 [Burkholderia stagnalis]|nr:hypothetical protein WT74_21015 [Burkholderia stagnalis]KVN82272.1 hypothetical protein WT15_08390 [Burkholderia stagnalis]KWO30421.1 hypothetical protein WT95_18200 [Burkholderia stagnalis]KWO35140.1 hypothetical protein WT96_17045 [Burkholderia stagnalis]